MIFLSLEKINRTFVAKHIQNFASVNGDFS
jgi:hypothetical protein